MRADSLSYFSVDEGFQGSFGESGDIARPGLVAYDLVCLCFVRSVSVSAAAVGLLVFKQLSRLLTREPPVDLGPFLVGPGGQAGLKAGSPPRLAAPRWRVIPADP